MSVPARVQELLRGYSDGQRDFREGDLPGAILTRAKLADVKLSKTNLTKADLSWADLSGADLSGADLSKADLGWAELGRANLAGANLIRANLIWATSSGANLSGANLSGANLSGANLSGADLGGANLRGATLSGVDLSRADLTKADLSWADLSKAKLNKATLIRADLIRADLSAADLSAANLNGASLSGANLSGANLSGANLSKSNLNGASLSQAILGWTVFGDVNLMRVDALTSAIHLAPSFVDLASLKLAQGRLPDAFLQSCGLADWEILTSKVYDRKLAQEDLVDLQSSIHSARIKPQVGRRVFISSSAENQDFAARMRSRLLDEGVPCWVDSHDIKSEGIKRPVDKIVGEDAILVLVLSESSIASDWLHHDVREVSSLEKRIGAEANVLCPVSLDDSWMDEGRGPRKVTEQLKEKLVLSFSQWRDPEWFEGQFRGLIDGWRLFQPPAEGGKREPD